MYYSYCNLFCRGLEQTDSSIIEDPTATTPQRLTPAKFSTAHVKGKNIARFFMTMILGHNSVDLFRCYTAAEK